MKRLKYIYIILGLLVLSACEDSDFPVPQASTIVPSFTFSSNSGGFAPDTIVFSNETIVTDKAGSVQYTWNFGDGNFSQEENPTHVFSIPGTYTVSLIAISSDQLTEYKADILVKDPSALQVKLSYIDGSSSYISDTDGNIFNTEGNGFGVEYDQINSFIYYTDDDNGKVWRSNIDGSNQIEIVSGLSDPRDLVVDAAGEKLWVVDRGSNSIVEVSLGDNTNKVLYSTSNGLGELPVGIDYHDGFLYITCVEVGSESIWKAKADGSGIENIINYSQGGYGYAVAVDQENEKIYFDNRDSFELLIANLDGSGINKIADTNGKVYGIAVDNTNGKLYWSDSGDRVLRMSDLDGDNVIDVAVDLTDPLGIFFIE